MDICSTEQKILVNEICLRPKTIWIAEMAEQCGVNNWRSPSSSNSGTVSYPEIVI